MDAELIEKKPCHCGAMISHFRIAETDYWRCDRGPELCGAIGKTYEEALRLQLQLFAEFAPGRMLH